MTDKSASKAAILNLTRRYPGAAPANDVGGARVDTDEVDLSPGDIRVLQFAAEGFVDKKIAEKLNQDPERVHERWRRIRRELGARNRSHAVAIALGVGLIAAPAQARMILARKR